MTRAEFLCPECGSTRPNMGMMINSDPPAGDDPNPWAGVLQAISCGACGFWIPAHLAERWDRLSAADARREWRDYRDWPDAREDGG